MAKFSFYSLSERKLGESGLFGLLHSAFVAGIGKSSISTYSVSSLVVPKMEEEFSGTGAVKNSK